MSQLVSDRPAPASDPPPSRPGRARRFAVLASTLAGLILLAVAAVRLTGDDIPADDQGPATFPGRHATIPPWIAAATDASPGRSVAVAGYPNV